MKQNSTILIVDDEKIGRDVLKGLLSGQGYELDFAASGREALDKAIFNPPDLILLDIMMPEIDGFEVCQRIRSTPVIAEVPIIMVTAYDDRKAKIKGIEAGADGFMGKPFDSLELQTRVRTITRLNRYRRLLMANQELESRIAQLRALYDILDILNSSTEADDILKSVIGKIKELINVEKVTVFLWDEGKSRLIPQDTPKDISSRQDIPKASKITNRVYKDGSSLMINDVVSNEDFAVISPIDVKRESGLDIRSILCVPLTGKEKTLGVIEVINKRDGIFTSDDQSLLEAMADNIAISIERATLYRDLQKTESILRRQNAELRLSVKKNYQFDNIVGKSNEMTIVIRRAEQVALTDATVLIYGETGTGKELLARAIHGSSLRASGNFVPLNCGAIPRDLLESELFGHEKGSFTGADKRRIGRFEEADGGTLFLDEIGDMPLALQVRLLRVLQEGIIQRLGSNESIKVDVRIIAATHEPLSDLVGRREFREDLYYRLKVFELEIPPLRDRKEDLPLLIGHFIHQYNEKLGHQFKGIDDRALDILRNYDYPGNIRELQHIIESAMILCKGDTIAAECLPKEFRIPRLQRKAMVSEIVKVPANKEELASAREEAQKYVEVMFLNKVLADSRGNISQAARQTGMNRSWLSELVSKHNIDIDQFKDTE